MPDVEETRNEFNAIFKDKIKRDGADKLFEYLNSRCDFFRSPASTKFHGSYEGGLARHSLNVYYCLVDFLSRPRVKELYKLDYSEETIAIVALLHDVCKVDTYVTEMRNAKNAQGKWEQVPFYKTEDKLPYGHGEKSVYIVNGFIRLTREEAMAIRWHMGFSGPEDNNLTGRALESYPLAFALATADMEATYFLES